MSEDINISCNILLHKQKEKKNELIKYDDNLAEYLASINNTKPRPKLDKGEIDEKGYWIRQRNFLTKPFGNGINDLKADKDRYIIYWAPGCNWSNRPVIVRDLLGLNDVILDYKVSHTGESNKYGWGFPEEPFFKDKYTGVYFLSDLYTNYDKNYTGRATTPTLADYKEKIAVNNDYHRLTNYFEVYFRKYQKENAPDLYPLKYREYIDEFNDWLFPNINDGHYRQAFAQSPEAYKDGQEAFHNALEKLDERLKTNRFVFGDYITDSDIRIYVSLIKWETDFYVNVGPQKKRISEYKNIWEYLKELYSIDEFKRYTNIPKDEWKGDANRFGTYLPRIAAKINWDIELKTDHERKKLSSDPNNLFLYHKKEERIEDYETIISQSIWNSSDINVRKNKNFKLKVDASINPLKGLLHN